MNHANETVFRRAALWLVFLVPFFYASYGLANWLASRHAHVPNVALDWEMSIPFWAWTIIPYWSINGFYALALFLNKTPHDVDRLAYRYLVIQIIAVACFMAFPLTTVFLRPETQGLPRAMFDLLNGFDKPFNQAPSLHIALLVVIWDHIRTKLKGKLRFSWHIWCAAIGLSVLTTYQHHIMDIPTGALLGLFALWLFPRQNPRPFTGFRWTRDQQAMRLGFYYTAGACLCLFLLFISIPWSGAALLWVWPMLALALVALGYFGASAAIFQKQFDGHVSLASFWLFLPYRFGVNINRWFWTRNLPDDVEVMDGVFLGGFPKQSQISRFRTVIDLTGELIAPTGTKTSWKSFPAMDLVTIPPPILTKAITAVIEAQKQGPVLICCALGFQRSAVVAGHWLLKSGKMQTPDEVQQCFEAKGRPIYLPASFLAFHG